MCSTHYTDISLDAGVSCDMIVVVWGIRDGFPTRFTSVSGEFMVHMSHVILQPAHRGKCNVALRAGEIPNRMFSSDVISQLSLRRKHQPTIRALVAVFVVRYLWCRLFKRALNSRHVTGKPWSLAWQPSFETATRNHWGHLVKTQSPLDTYLPLSEFQFGYILK